MPYPSASAVEIDRKLREDFRRRLKEFGVDAEVTDPVLAVLFRTFAQQLEQLYNDTGRIRLALLDELITGLGLEKRMSRPAQTVVRFHGARAQTLIDAGTPLTGESQSGSKFSFQTDASFCVSSAQVSFALTYEEGQLRFLGGVEVPEAVANARPALEPVRINLGKHPAIYLAVEGYAQDHLSQHAFYFDLTPDALPIQRALQSETWALADQNGRFSAKGILRPRQVNAGVAHLQWLLGVEQQVADRDTEIPVLPPGFYAGRVFLMPVVPASRRSACRVPVGLEAALQRIFGREGAGMLSAERVWIKISLPSGLPALHTAISNVSMHAMTASNVECFNQTIYFERHGTSVPVSKEGGTSWHLVRPLSVAGEDDTPYLTDIEPSTNPNVGRFSIRNGRIELTPARWPNDKPHAYANVRVWTSAGSAANDVGPGRVTSVDQSHAPGLRITNPTGAAGGTDGESWSEARDRFTAALLSRDRVVTRADLYAVVKSFDRRIQNAAIRSGVERFEGALRRVEHVTLTLDEADFTDPGTESQLMCEDLQRLLPQRFLHDITVRLHVEWAA